MGPYSNCLLGPLCIWGTFSCFFVFFGVGGAGSFVDNWVSFCCSNQWCGCVGRYFSSRAAFLSEAASHGGRQGAILMLEKSQAFLSWETFLLKNKLPCLKLTARTWQWMIGIRSFPCGIWPIFRGEDVSFRECNSVISTCYLSPPRQLSEKKPNQKPPYDKSPNTCLFENGRCRWNGAGFSAVRVCTFDRVGAAGWYSRFPLKKHHQVCGN